MDHSYQKSIKKRMTSTTNFSSRRRKDISEQLLEKNNETIEILKSIDNNFTCINSTLKEMKELLKTWARKEKD